MSRGYFYLLNQTVTSGWVFQTESDVPTDTFDPFFTTINGEVATFELIGGYTETTNSLSIAARTGLSGTPNALTAGELNGVCQNVQVTFSTETPENITDIDFNTDNICGILDLSLFTEVDNFLLYDNPSLTGMINPISSKAIQNYYAYNSGLEGNLDISMFSNFGGKLRVQNNPLLTIISNPLLTTRSVNSYWVYNCGLVGGLNMSGYEKLGGIFYAYGNPLLTNINHGSTINTTVFSRYYAFSCNLLSLDLSKLTFVGGRIRFDRNRNLASVTNAASPTQLVTYYGYSCALSFVDFSIFTSTSNNVDIRLYDNVINAANAQTMIDDLDAQGWTNGSILLHTQTPALTGGEITTIQASASYINLTAVLGWTITF